MRQRGRTTSIPKEMIENAVKEYLESDKTAKEIAESIGLTDATLHYHVKKYKERTEEHGN